jgi:NitT/TauT family transport system substrate-binding protein
MRRSPFLRSLASTAVVAGALPVPAYTQDLPTITLATLINDTATSALYASRAGIFHKYGLDVNLQVLTSGAAAATAVLGGAAQFALSSLVGVYVAHDHGIPFTLVAPAGLYTSDVPYTQFVVRTDSTIKTGRDLNGKTIGSPGLKDLDTVAIQNWVDRNGGDSKTLKFVEMSGSVALAAIEEGRIDGADLNTPTLTRGLEGGKVRTLAQIFDAIAPRFENTAWFGTTDYVSKNRDVVTRFARAMAESAAYCNAHHEATVAMVAETAKIDDKLVARMARITFADYLRPGDLQPLINVAAKYGVISKPFDARAIISPAALKPA